MSYQFEDDSALEELLNQQLDRRKQQYTTSSSRPRPTTAKLSSITIGQQRNYATQLTSSPNSNEAQNSIEHQQSEPSITGERDELPQKATPNEEPTSLASISQSKLASWLEGKPTSSKSPVAEEPNMSTKKQHQSRRQSDTSSAKDAGQASSSLLDEAALREDRLQEMSKQGLIRFILGTIVPHLQQVEHIADERCNLKLVSLKMELETERQKLKVADDSRIEEIRSLEDQHARDRLKLEDQLNNLRNELAELHDKQREAISELESDYKKHIGKLKDTYEAKMLAERQRYEKTIERREELHKNEINSSSRLNCDLEKLETTMESWRQQLATALDSLDRKFGSCSQCKQASEKATGERRASELLDQVTSMLSQMGDLLAQLSGSRSSQDKLMGELGAQLGQLIDKSEQLAGREQELELAKAKWAADERRLAEQKLELSLDTGKLECREQRLAELRASNRELEERLARERADLLEREAQLGVARGELEAERRQVDSASRELSSLRDQLAGKAQELGKLELRLASERKSLDKWGKRASGESKRLAQLRDRLAKELGQLRRLQGSLVCTICLDRLFSGSKLTGEDQLAGSRTLEIGAVPLAASRGLLNHDDLDEELAKLRGYLERDAKQLGAENKYIELLSMS